MTDSFADNDGVRIAWERRTSAGDAGVEDTPVVLVQGLGYGRWGWEPVVADLAGHHDVILLDNRGIGGSDVPAGPYTAAGMATDVVAVLDAAGVERAHVVGVSLGGMVAQEVALGWPGRVDRLVLVSTTFGGDDAHPIPPATRHLLARMPDMEPVAALRAAADNALGDVDGADREQIAEPVLGFLANR